MPMSSTYSVRCGRLHLRGLLVAAILAMAAAPQPLQAAPDILPEESYVSARSGGVVLHYPRQYRRIAARIAAIAAWSRPALEHALGYTPRSDIHVVIVVDNDFANGFAMVTPRNTIRLFIAPPRQPSLLAEYDDWLELLFVHELLHIYHLDWHEWPASLLRYTLGRNFIQAVEVEGTLWPLYLGFANGMLPDTLIEGYAVAFESRLIGRGRANSSLGLSLLRNAARDGALPPLDAAIGVRRAWPRGNAPRLYGGRYHLYAQAHGVDWAKVYRLQARGLFPGLWGVSLGLAGDTLPLRSWNAWRQSELQFQRSFDAALSQSTDGVRWQGPFQNVAALRFAPDGRLVAAVRGTMHPAELRAYADDGSAQTWGEHFGGQGLAFAADGTLWLDQFDVVRDTLTVSELFTGRPGGKLKRRTVGGHIYEPDMAAGYFVWVRRRAEVQCLEWGDAATLRVEQRLCAAPFAALHHPRLSPDGRTVAVVRWHPAGRDDIYLWRPRDQTTQRLTYAPSDDRMPQWSSDGRQIFAIRSLDGVPDLYAYSLSQATWRRHTRTRTGMWHYALAADGRLVYASAEGEGMWLRRLERLPPAGPPVSEAVRPGPDPRWTLPGPAVTPVTAALANEQPYRAWRTLWPTAWTPVFGVGAGPADTFGLRLGGSDVKQDWSWAARVLWRRDGHPDLAATVTHDRGAWRYGAGLEWDTLAVLDVAGSVRRADRVRPELRLVKPIRRQDWGASWSLELAHEKHFDGDDNPTRMQLGSVFSFDNRDRLDYALVGVDGVFLRLLGAGDAPVGGVTPVPLDAQGLDCRGGDGDPDARAEAIAVSGWAPQRHLQFVAQVAAAGHADPEGRLCYTLHPPYALDFGARDYSGRGVPPRAPGTSAQGQGIFGVHRFSLWEAEAIVPLYFIERGIRSLPFYFDHVALRGFAAGAHWWRRGFWDRDLYVGAELGADVGVFWSGVVPLRLVYRRSLVTAAQDVYVGTGFNFAAGGVLFHSQVRRGLVPACFECPR